MSANGRVWFRKWQPSLTTGLILAPHAAQPASLHGLLPTAPKRTRLGRCTDVFSDSKPLTCGCHQSCQDQTWKALGELQAAGKIKEIGVSNWQLSNLKRMKDLRQQLPAVNQIEFHIGWHDDAMLEWCAANGVLVQAATPLSRGAILNHPTVMDIAAKHNQTAAQVALRFLIERGVSPIPSATKPTYQAENLDIFDFHLTEAEVVALANVRVPCRGDPASGLQKCWADPATIMCADTSGRMFHCP